MFRPVARLGCRSLAVVVLATACGGTTFDGHVYQNSELSFRLSDTPQDWRRIDADGALLAYRDDSAPASIIVNARCGKDGDDVPLASLTHHLFLQFTDRDIESQTALTIDGREALNTQLLARLDGVQKRFSVFVLKKNGCVYDFVHIAPPEAPETSRREFATFVQGFSTIRP
jgi:hypothetical protein